MARFDVYDPAGMAGYVLDVQSDLLSGLNTRMVVPLLPPDQAPRPAARLNPLFELGGKRLVMVTQFMAAVPQSELGQPVGSLAAEDHRIVDALDMIFFGF